VSSAHRSDDRSNLFPRRNPPAILGVKCQSGEPTTTHDVAHAPDLTYQSVIELPRLGALAHQRRARMSELFAELLNPSFAAIDEPPPNPETLSLCISGGIWETIRRHAAARQLHELPDTLPAISQVCLSTLYGIDEAHRASSQPPT
jgi:hypothetical protein